MNPDNYFVSESGKAIPIKAMAWVGPVEEFQASRPKGGKETSAGEERPYWTFKIGINHPSLFEWSPEFPDRMLAQAAREWILSKV